VIIIQASRQKNDGDLVVELFLYRVTRDAREAD
jgi:hypothetical protein